MSTKIINLTPHALNIHTPSGVVDVPPSGQVARLSTQDVPQAPVGNIPTVTTVYGAVSGLPEPDEDTIFVVSGMVLDALGGGRPDVMAPGSLVRDEQGRPTGCNGLRRG